ncbi:MAG: efflux RND transporter periplasmic adaptor subunit [Bacteroidaceae bacterium]|nr:efflux RND transporter periplasmic adaptor subunit [Bacteroidaceae bacterium]
MRTLSIIALVATTALLACTPKQQTREKAPVRVKTETLSAAQTTAAKTYVGVIEEAQATAVSFTGMGTVKRVYVSEGQNVGRGQLIAELDDTQARNLLATAQAAASQAEDALQRYSLLHERGSLTEAQWVEIQSKVTQARSQLAVAKKNLADCRLTAPVSGIIGKKNVNAGETAMPSQAVVTILDINSVKVRFSVPETEVRHIAPNTASQVTVDALGQTFAGGRIEKGVQADALTHTYDLRVRVNNSSRTLLPGMVAKVEIGVAPSQPRGTAPSQPPRGGATISSGIPAVTQVPPRGGREGAEGAFTLPLTAVQRRADGSLFAWTVDKSSTAHRTPVEIGATLGNRVAILSGLAAGQLVVIEGYQKLSEGTKVVY